MSKGAHNPVLGTTTKKTNRLFPYSKMNRTQPILQISLFEENYIYFVLAACMPRGLYVLLALINPLGIAMPMGLYFTAVFFSFFDA